MKFIYLTSQKYPSKKADPFFWKSTATAFAEILDLNFLFVVRGGVSEDLKGINTISVRSPGRFKVVFYFFCMPVLVLLNTWSNKEAVFFSSDSYLLSILIFWRKAFRFKYSVCSDWHQLFDDWRDKYISRNSDYLISTSERLKRLLSSVCGIEPNKILVAYGGVNTSPFIEKSKINKVEHRKKLKLPADSFLVGYVGGFRSVGMEKGLNTMIKALPYLDEKIHMIFVGGSKQHIDEYRELAKEGSIAHRCIFVEKQPFEKVVEYELAVDILVIPYPDKHHFRNYGFPMKVWEYMASGRPIVYSDLEIIGEILEKRGVPFQPDDVHSLANAVSFIFQDIEPAERIAKENSRDVQLYTWKARAENIIKFIRR